MCVTAHEQLFVLVHLWYEATGVASDLSRESVLIRAAQRALRPLIRQMLRHGITFGAFAEIAKRVYFQVADDDFPLPGRRQTDSRIALLTGLSRRDVARLRSTRARPAATRLDANLATRFVDVWSNDPRYHTDSGNPRVLPFEARDRKAPSFCELVRRVGGDIPPRALLDELVRVGSVELQATRDVRLLQKAYIPATDSSERLEMLGEDVAEFTSVVAHNLESPAHDAFLQQKVIYDNVGGDGLPDLRAELRRLGETFLRRVNKLIAAHDRDRNPQAPGGDRKRVVMGVYYFHDDENVK